MNKYDPDICFDIALNNHWDTVSGYTDAQVERARELAKALIALGREVEEKLCRSVHRGFDGLTAVRRTMKNIGCTERYKDPLDEMREELETRSLAHNLARSYMWETQDHFAWPGWGMGLRGHDWKADYAERVKSTTS